MSRTMSEPICDAPAQDRRSNLSVYRPPVSTRQQSLPLDKLLGNKTMGNIQKLSSVLGSERSMIPDSVAQTLQFKDWPIDELLSSSPDRGPASSVDLMSKPINSGSDTLPHDFQQKYRLVGSLGTGSYGLILIAVRIALPSPSEGLPQPNIPGYLLKAGEEVAVKVIPKDRIRPENWIMDPGLGKIPLEVYILRACHHPHIVAFLDFFETDPYVFIVMELHGKSWKKLPTLYPSAANYSNKMVKSTNRKVTRSYGSEDQSPYLEDLDRLDSDRTIKVNAQKDQKQGSFMNMLIQGRSQTLPNIHLVKRTSMDLFECIEHHAYFSEQQSRFVARQVVETIAYLHAKGIVHRDIKDENIVIDSMFNAKLIDFGSAAILPSPAKITFFRRFHGTVQYACPEILRKEKYIARAADIWALGILLYVMLTGTFPFDSSQAAISEPFKLPPVRLSMQVTDLLCWCLEKNALDRPTAKQMLYHPWFKDSLF